MIPIEQPKVGFTLRSFTERTFGVWLDGCVSKVDRDNKVVTIRFGHGRDSWTERFPFNYGFYYPKGHKLVGEEFHFSE